MKAWTSAMFSGFTDTSETLYALETLRSSEKKNILLIKTLQPYYITMSH